VRELITGFMTGQFSPLDLVDELIDRVDRLDGQLHAIIHLDRRQARADARNATEQYRDGGPTPSLLGVPVAIKDIINVAGQPTSFNSRVHKVDESSCDAVVVSQLRRAGAIVFGKTNTYEFALGGPSFDSQFEPARNPWDPRRHPGGSSSGAAVGLASGFFPLAVGTDTAGSIRHPANACGVVGHKPTHGRLSMDGIFPVSTTMDDAGPMARSVEDAFLLLKALEGGLRSAERPLAGRHTPPKVAFVRSFVERDYVPAPEIGAALESTLDAITQHGGEVVDVDLPPVEEFGNASWSIILREAWALHASRMRRAPELYGERTRNMLLAGSFVTAGDYIAALDERQRLSGVVDRALEQVDVLVAGGSMHSPCKIDDDDAIAETYFKSGRIPFSLSGHPAVSVPVAPVEGGPPVSVQIVGRKGADQQVLEAAAFLESCVKSVFAPPAWLAD
jgi:aspartyl-tRNA(Asn)/glutamyl-tRNA(Gln) amidotransferase subunit A